MADFRANEIDQICRPHLVKFPVHLYENLSLNYALKNSIDKAPKNVIEELSHLRPEMEVSYYHLGEQDGLDHVRDKD